MLIFVYIIVTNVSGEIMLNPNLVKFIVQHNLEESMVEEKTVEVKQVKFKRAIDKMHAYSRFAVIPVEVRE